MRRYDVHFSFYDETYGNFDDTSYRVVAKDAFEARAAGWEVCGQDEQTMFRSNIREIAVTWKPNMLDAGDYFYSQAAYNKLDIGRIMNVKIPNSRIENREQPHLEEERYSNLGALYTLDEVAKDLYADKGIIPPSVYEELHYAEKLCGCLDYFDKTEALWGCIEEAKKWDRCAIYKIRDLFANGYTTLNGETVSFRERFGRDGIYPVYGSLEEFDYTYISRWNKGAIGRLAALPVFQLSDVIVNSAGNMDYEWQILLLDNSLLKERCRMAKNQLWKPVDVSEQGSPGEEGMILVENVITGEKMTCNKSSFLGALRPDIVARLDFENLKKDYAATNYIANDNGNRDYNACDENDNEHEQ